MPEFTLYKDDPDVEIQEPTPYCVPLTEGDVRYLAKLVDKDLVYRRKRASKRKFVPRPGQTDSDATRIAKACRLAQNLRGLMEVT